MEKVTSLEKPWPNFLTDIHHIPALQGAGAVANIIESYFYALGDITLR